MSSVSKKKRPALRCLYADAKVWKVQKRRLPRAGYAEIPWKHFKWGLHTTPHHMRVSATNLTWKLKYLLQLPRLMVKYFLTIKKNQPHLYILRGSFQHPHSLYDMDLPLRSSPHLLFWLAQWLAWKRWTHHLTSLENMDRIRINATSTACS